MIIHFTKAIGQLSDPAFRRVLILGLAGAFLALIACYFLTRFGMNWLALQDLPWVDGTIEFLTEWGLIPIFLVASYFLFPAFALIVMSLFLDDVVDAVEDRFYPHDKAGRDTTIMEGLKAGLRLGGTMVLWNILAIPLYIILFFTFIGPFALYLVLNGYLLGREYVELVSVRHMGLDQAKYFRRQNRFLVLGVGVIGSGLFMIPFINLLAPLILAAASVHGFHAQRFKGEFRAL